MNFSQGHSGTKVQCESRLFSQGKTPEFTKMGEIHELFVWPLSLVWFGGATPDYRSFLLSRFGLIFWIGLNLRRFGEWERNPPFGTLPAR